MEVVRSLGAQTSPAQVYVIVVPQPETRYPPDPMSWSTRLSSAHGISFDARRSAATPGPRTVCVRTCPSGSTTLALIPHAAQAIPNNTIHPNGMTRIAGRTPRPTMHVNVAGAQNASSKVTVPVTPIW